MFKNFCLSFVAVLCVVGCSTATERSDYVNQSRIHQRYTVRYEKPADKTFVSAEFRFGDASGTTLRLVGTARVKHETVPLREGGFFGTEYSGERRGLFSNTKFEFFDSDGTRYANQVLLPLIDLRPPAVVNRSTGIEVVWAGPPLGPGEEVEVRLRDTLGGVATGTVRAVGARSVVLPPIHAPMANGPGALSLVRTKVSDLDQRTRAGGYSSAAYVTDDYHVRIAD